MAAIPELRPYIETLVKQIIVVHEREDGVLHILIIVADHAQEFDG